MLVVGGKGLCHQLPHTVEEREKRPVTSRSTGKCHPEGFFGTASVKTIAGQCPSLTVVLVVLQVPRKRELELQEMEKLGMRAAGAEQPPQRGSVSAPMQEIPALQTSPWFRWAPGWWDGSGGSWGAAGYRQHFQVTFVRALENALTGWNEKPHFPRNEGILKISTLCYH